ncbi:hypothetical protein MHBO_005127, partial [Bonamia ostreae]
RRLEARGVFEKQLERVHINDSGFEVDRLHGKSETESVCFTEGRDVDAQFMDNIEWVSADFDEFVFCLELKE